LLFGGNRVWTLNAQVNGTNLKEIIDSGATVSVIAKKFVCEQALKKEEAYPVQVANGETFFTLGSTILTMKFDECLFEQKVQVMDTSAFDAVLGLDFLSGNARCGGILTQPPPEKLLFDGKLFPLKQARVDGIQVFRMFRAFKKESYTLIDQVKMEALEKLGLKKGDFGVDLFANFANAQAKKFCTRKTMPFTTIGLFWERKVCCGATPRSPNWKEWCARSSENLAKYAWSPRIGKDLHGKDC
jgi:hypothetical protein